MLIHLLRASPLFRSLLSELFLEIVDGGRNLHYVTFFNVTDLPTMYRTSASRYETMLPANGVKVTLCDKRILLCCGTMRKMRENQCTVVFAYATPIPAWLDLIKPRHACMIV